MVRPRWIAGTDRFWYPRETGQGVVVTEVEAATGAQTAATEPRADAAPPGRPGETVSPDGRLAAFRRGHDLWVRDLASGGERALTLRLVDALIRADKDFDLIVLPNDDHTTVWSNPYFLRRAMAFMLDRLGGPDARPDIAVHDGAPAD